MLVEVNVISPVFGLQTAFTISIVLSVTFAVIRPYKSLRSVSLCLAGCVFCVIF